MATIIDFKTKKKVKVEDLAVRSAKEGCDECPYKKAMVKIVYISTQAAAESHESEPTSMP